MRVFLAAVILIAICVVGMCFNIIFRKNGKFPQTDISSNEKMRQMGIRCMKEEEDEVWGDKKVDRKSDSCTGSFSDACIGCSLFPSERQKEKKK